MTDPRDAMLNAARALHDRSADEPLDCGTCRDAYGNPARWPCPTATALGATGRSEWENPTASDPDTLRRVHIPQAGRYFIGTGARLEPDTRTEIAFETDTHHNSGCESAPQFTGPIGPHGPFNPHPERYCQEADGNASCILDRGHHGPCHYGFGVNARCHHRMSTMSCVLNEGHQGNHSNQQGIRWRSCGFITVIKGEAWPCTLDESHTGPHCDQNGVMW